MSPSEAAFLTEPRYPQEHDHSRPYSKLPRKVYVPRAYLKQGSKVAQDLIDGFIINLDKKLGMTIEEIDLDKKIADRGFDAAKLEQLQSDALTWHVLSVSGHSTANIRHSWVKNGKQFKEDYGRLNGGRAPPVDPIPREIWEEAERNGSW